MKVIGLMSGTSLDGIDVAVMEIRGRAGDEPEWALLSHDSYPYSPEQRAAILQVIQGASAAIFSVCTWTLVSGSRRR